MADIVWSIRTEPHGMGSVVTGGEPRRISDRATEPREMKTRWSRALPRSAVKKISDISLLYGKHKRKGNIHLADRGSRSTYFELRAVLCDYSLSSPADGPEPIKAEP
jgi:hypothetical protein